MQIHPFLRFCLGLLMLPLAMTPPSAHAAGRESRVFIGTYTGASSKGIHAATLDLRTGRLSAPALVAECPSPSFLALHPNGKYLYAVNEVGSFEGKPGGIVSAYAIDAATGALTLLNQQTSSGPGPCHLALDRAGRFVVVANYSGGSVAAVAVGADGRLGATTGFAQHTGSSVNRGRQEAPHAHGVTFDKTGRHVFVPDLGLDKIIGYELDPATGALTASAARTFATRPGAGPRHFAFDPSARTGYAINELDCTVTGWHFDAGARVLGEIGTVSTLPAGETVQRGYSTAEIEVHPSGRFVYGSNRGHNTIVVFARDATSGALRVVQHQPTGGRTPRNFALAPGGRWLLVGNQDSDSIDVFAVHQKTGHLTRTPHTVSVGKPVSLVFLPVP